MLQGSVGGSGRSQGWPGGATYLLAHVFTKILLGTDVEMAVALSGAIAFTVAWVVLASVTTYATRKRHREGAEA